MDTFNREHYKINRTHVATITIDENSKQAKLGPYPIVKISDSKIIYFHNLIIELQALIDCINSDKDNNELYIKLEKDLLNAENYLQDEPTLSRISQNMNYCVSSIKVEIDDEIYVVTCYCSAYDGINHIENNAQVSYIKKLDHDFKENFERYKSYIDANSKDKEKLYIDFTDRVLYPENSSLTTIKINQNKKKQLIIKEKAANFCTDILQRLYLYTYELTINEIKKIKGIKAYSAKKVGWTTYWFDIGDEYTAKINSNFGYGSVSYFYLIVTFRGIQLTPYSLYVKYRFANKLDIHRYTISAHCYESEWGRLFEYIVESYNIALDSVDKFFDKYFINELDTMVSTLEEWFYMPKNDQNFEILDSKIYSINNSKKYCTKISRDSFDFEYFQLEKISGSLEFIESIQAIKEVISVQSYIDRILSLNRQILPLAEHRIEFFKEEIANAKLSLKNHEKRKNILIRNINSRIEARTKEITNAYFTINKLNEICDEDDSYSRLIDLPTELSELDNDSLYLFARLIEVKENPEFEQTEEELENEIQIIRGINSVIDNNKEWQSKYNDCLVIIKKYFKISRKKRNL